MAASTLNPPRFSWQQTMLRIKDPKISVPFYENHFGFKQIHFYHFPQWNFSLYFLAILPEGATHPEPGTVESEEYLWNFDGVCLELTHNHGTENDDSFAVNNGNVEPHRGFGHIAVMTKDVVGDCVELEANGVRFHKRPHEGRMKNIAFALDPDNYWIEIVPRALTSTIKNKFTFAQTMIRVKDAHKSLSFYRDFLGMTLIKQSHFSDFSLYFLANLSTESKQAFDELMNNNNNNNNKDELASTFIENMFEPVLELTHNHNTELDNNFHYHNGNDTDNNALRGFGHIGFLVDNLENACEYLEKQCHVEFKKKPSDGNMKEIAFAFDPDRYWVEIIQRKGLKMMHN